MNKLAKVIQTFFGLLFFTVPLVLWPYTSELFEFNKMIIVYIFTILIVATWVIRSISQRKFIFSRTILDIPLLFFLGSQLISTILSIDTTTSWLGYYSRFNGGFISMLCYSLLYWAFVSNVNKSSIPKLIRHTLVSAVLVSIYGVLEHLGIDKDVWVQDVQNRVFSTLGQPNWLAAWLVALLPITWFYTIENSKKKISFKKIIPYLLNLLFFVVLIFTGSRSGLLGFAVAVLVFWIFIFIRYKFRFLKEFIVVNLSILVCMGIFGTQLTPSVFSLIKKTQTEIQTTEVITGTALENGGTESGTIRKIVWEGAVETWKHYPVFGTGVETFAYSYYLFRPVAHNLTSEWDFIYNKAHNEYLNYLANTGTIGILAYLSLIGFSIYQILNLTKIKDPENDIKYKDLGFAVLSGYVSILITNFFGFSVVPIQILFYLFPAFIFVLVNDEEQQDSKANITTNQKIVNWIIICIAATLLFVTCRYWYADTLYAKGVNYDKVNRFDLSPTLLTKAIKLEPKQSLYYAEIAKAYTNLALAYNSEKDSTTASELTNAAVEYSNKAVDLSPANVNIKRMQFGVYVMLSSINTNYLFDAKDVLVSAINQAPSDAKLYYNLGLIYARIGQDDQATQTLAKAVELKPNYKDARLAYAILLINTKRDDEARPQLEYILTNLDPEDSMAKQYLEEIN